MAGIDFSSVVDIGISGNLLFAVPVDDYAAFLFCIPVIGGCCSGRKLAAIA